MNVKIEFEENKVNAENEELNLINKYVDLFWKFNIESIEDINKSKIDKEIHKLINKLLIESGFVEKEENLT